MDPLIRVALNWTIIMRIMMVLRCVQKIICNDGMKSKIRIL